VSQQAKRATPEERQGFSSPLIAIYRLRGPQ